jgi:tetratricopeptide (TPR) repeat protein
METENRKGANMIRRGIPLVVTTTLILALAAAAQVDVGSGGGPAKVGPRPEMPFDPGQSPAAMRDRAEAMRGRAREAQELADRLRFEADQLDRQVQEQFGPGPEGSRKVAPGQRETVAIKEKIGLLRDQAVKAKAEGRFEQSQRLWNEAEDLETRLARGQQIRGMAEELGAMKRKAAVVRQQAMQAKQEGRYEEAGQLSEKAEQIEQQMQARQEKIDRFKMDSQSKDRQMKVERAKKQGVGPKTSSPSKEIPASKEPVKMAPKGTPQDSELIRAVEELQGEVKQLRRELQEMKSRSGDSPAK